MDCKVDSTKSGCLTFYPGGISTIIWRPTGGQVSESSRSPRGEPSSHPSQKPTGSSAIPIPEISCKSLSHTPILLESHPTRVPKRLAQPDSLAVDLDESSSMPSVKGMDPDNASSAALHLPPEEGINQVGDSSKVRNSISWQYLA